MGNSSSSSSSTTHSFRHETRDCTAYLSDEVDDDEVEDDVREDEVGEGALRREAFEVCLVGRIHLDAETHGEHEAAHARDEAGEKAVERERAHQAAVGELNDTGEQNVQEISIDQLDLLGCLLHVETVEFPDHGYQTFSHF